MFITFEGLDQSGKSTQATLLVDCLRRHQKDVLFLREPGGTPISERVRDILLDRSNLHLTDTSELLLFSAARAQLVREVIRPALEGGRLVVADRFYDSTTAYQGYGRGIPLDEVKFLNRLATGGTTPQLTVLVDIEIAEMTRRQQAAGRAVDRMESSGRTFYERVRQGYLAIAREEPGRIAVVDGMRRVEVIQDEIWKLVNSRITG